MYAFISQTCRGRGVITLRVSSDQNESADIELLSSDTRSDFEDKLLDALEQTPSHLIVKLCPAEQPELTQPEALSMIIASADVCDWTVLVSSEKVSNLLVKYLPAGQRPQQFYLMGTKRLNLYLGDLTEVVADAIVNPSNQRLKLGGGVSGAIAKKAQPELQQAMYRLAARSELTPGDAVVTTGYGLLAPNIIHVVSNIGTQENIKNALHNLMRLAAEKGFSHIALPAIGTGVGQLNISLFAKLFKQVICTDKQALPAEITLVLWDAGDFGLCQQVFEQ